MLILQASLSSSCNLDTSSPFCIVAPISAKGDTVERGRSLDQCPAHIIQAIAAFTEDERTIWSLMKTSRTVRRAAEGALKPHLAERMVTARPPFVTDIFRPIDDLFARDSPARYRSLDAARMRFEDYLDAYPPASRALKRLTYEFNDQSGRWGFSHLKRFAHQLEKLEVQVYESEWRRSVLDGLEDDEYRETAEEEEQDGDDRDTGIDSDSADVWHAFGNTLKDSGRAFNNLTHFRMFSTANVLEHFLALGRLMPALRSLTLASHMNVSYQVPCFDSDDLVFAHLHHLTLTGDGRMLEKSLAAILPASPSLRLLTVDTTDHLSNGHPPCNHSQIFQLLAKHKGLTGLVLSGTLALRLRTIWMLQQQNPQEAYFEGLTDLIVV